MKEFLRRLPIFLVVAGMVGVGFVACSATSAATEDIHKSPRTHYTFYQELPNGNKVLCVWASNDPRSGGLSCDFAGDSIVKE